MRGWGWGGNMMKVKKESWSSSVTSYCPRLLSRPNRVVSAFHFLPLSLLPSLPFTIASSLPSHFSFFFSCLGESGRRRRRTEVADLQEFGSLSHPRFELCTTAPLVLDCEVVCPVLPSLFPPCAGAPCPLTPSPSEPPPTSCVPLG